MNRIVHKEYECGCRITTQSQEGFGEYLIEYCPLHKSAPKLCEALKFVSNQIIAWTDFRPELTSYTKLATETIDEALAEAEGK